MSKVAIIADTHFGRRNDSSVFLNYFNEFYEKVFFPTLEKYKIKEILHAGDLVERKKFLNSNTLYNMNSCFLDRVESEGYNMKLVLGNHDIYHKNTNEVNFPEQLLKKYKNIQVVKDVEEYIIDESKFLLCGWICDENKEKILSKMSSTDAEFLFGHFEFNGFSTGVVTMKDGLEPSGLEKFRAVFSGHFHESQTQNNIHYIGCPYEMDFFDVYQNKGFRILDTVTGEYEFIPNPSKIFQKFIYDDTNHSILKDCCSDFSVFKDSYVKVIVQNKTNIKLFEQFKENLISSSPADLDIDDYFVLRSSSTDENYSLPEYLDTLEAIEKYVAENVEFEDKESLVSYFKTTYIEAENSVKIQED